MTDITNAHWVKSSRSDQNGACVEVTCGIWGAGIRDSKNPAGGHIPTSTVAFGHFLDMLKAHGFAEP